MSFTDILLIPVLILPLIPAAVMGFTGHGWFYFLTLFVFYLCFGLFEFLSIKFRKKSISKDIAETKPALFWAIVASWVVLAGGLSLHWALMR